MDLAGIADPSPPLRDLKTVAWQSALEQEIHPRHVADALSIDLHHSAIPVRGGQVLSACTPVSEAQSV